MNGLFVLKLFQYSNYDFFSLHAYSSHTLCMCSVRNSRISNLGYSVQPYIITRAIRETLGPAIKEIRTFFNLKKKVPTAIKLEGVGGIKAICGFTH